MTRASLLFEKRGSSHDMGLSLIIILVRVEAQAMMASSLIITIINTSIINTRVEARAIFQLEPHLLLLSRLPH